MPKDKRDRLDDAMDRRRFIKVGATIGASFSLGAPAILRGQESPNETVVAAVVGLGRGLGLIQVAARVPNLEVGFISDVDERRIATARGTIADEKLGREPAAEKDFRDLLDKPDIDAVFIATCNHWHTPATVLACAAGKHVYVEKPGSHNPREGELIVAAAKRYDRRVQMGNQRRSWPSIREAIERLRGGAIGRVLYARCWYSNSRDSIGRGQPADPPGHLDYALWQGPAPRLPFKDNLIHYNWHWHWHWGNGELGNNGIHALDIARWGLGVEYPTMVSYVGGRYHHPDDQETPDTGTAVFHFGERGATWEGSSCHPRRPENLSFVTFYGESGSLAITDPGYVIYDLAGKEVERPEPRRDDALHVGNFVEAIRDHKVTLNSEIGDAQKSTLLCHLGNISYRTGRTLRFDPVEKKIADDKEAQAFWEREYEPGFEPEVNGA
jgi:predicted dehydrogenase